MLQTFIFVRDEQIHKTLFTLPYQWFCTSKNLFQVLWSVWFCVLAAPHEALPLTSGLVILVIMLRGAEHEVGCTCIYDMNWPLDQTMKILVSVFALCSPAF